MGLEFLAGQLVPGLGLSLGPTALAFAVLGAYAVPFLARPILLTRRRDVT
jgi:hypothetical protein